MPKKKKAPAPTTVKGSPGAPKVPPPQAGSKGKGGSPKGQEK